jgi:predicted nucleic acid-binding protein
MNLIVDASVALKWFVREHLSATAHDLLRTPDTLSAPDIIIAEIANAAWVKTVRGDISAAQASMIVAAMQYGEVALRPSTDVAERALDIALALNHPVYDCLYIAWAERLDGIVVTADDRLCRAVENGAFASLVRPLRDIAGPPS